MADQGVSVDDPTAQRGAGDSSAPNQVRSEYVDPRALYNEGMSHYRGRRYREAKACFTRLQALDPNWRGLDAILRELEIFVQLQPDGAEPIPEEIPAGATAGRALGEVGQQDGRGPLAFEEESREGAARRFGPREGDRWWVKLLVALVVLLSAATIVYAVVIVPPKSNNLCQAYSVARQYCKAIEACSALSASAPEDREAENNLKNAKSKLYDEALANIKSNTQTSLVKARDNLECIFRTDPNYKDVRTLIDRIKLREKLDATYQEAVGQLGRQSCDKAEELLLQVRAMDGEYNSTGVADSLYSAYVCQARQRMDAGAAGIRPAANPKPDEPAYVVSADVLAELRLAVKYAEKALKEKPSGDEAKSLRASGDRLLVGLERYTVKYWKECSDNLAEVYRSDAAYFRGYAAAILCDAYRHLADAQSAGGDLVGALSGYQRIVAMQGCKVDAVRTRAYEVGLLLTPTATPTPTPSPTASPTATNTPRPTATATLVPTSTPLPTLTPSPTHKPPESSEPGPGPGPGPQPQPTAEPPPRR